MQGMGPFYVPPFPFRGTYLKGKDGDSVSSKGGQVILLQRPIRSSPARRQTPELSPNSSSSESLSLAQRKKPPWALLAQGWQKHQEKTAARLKSDVSKGKFSICDFLALTKTCSKLALRFLMQ